MIESKKKIFEVLTKTLQKRDEIIFAYLHGSYLDGLLFNDVDVALYVDEKKISRQTEPDYCEQLNMELSVLTGLVVDIRIMNQAPVGFQHGVFKHGRLLFSRDDVLRSDLIEETSMEIMDYYELSLQGLRDIVYDGN